MDDSTKQSDEEVARVLYHNEVIPEGFLEEPSTVMCVTTCNNRGQLLLMPYRQEGVVSPPRRVGRKDTSPLFPLHVWSLSALFVACYSEHGGLGTLVWQLVAITVYAHLSRWAH